MFRPTTPQLPLFGGEAGLAKGLRNRLRDSWAEVFRQEVMPALLAAEERFATLYSEKGRPNWSVARLLGLCLLQQLEDMKDQQALDALGFDVRWQYALGVSPDEAYLSRRSLVDFRSRLVKHDPDGLLMREVFDRLCVAGIAKLGLSTAEQRVDSTLICSNIRARGRLSLARETLRVFVRTLDDTRRARIPEGIQAWYAADGSWEEEKADEAKRRLSEMGEWIATVVELFANDEEVAAGEPYLLLGRMLSEHATALGRAPQEVDDEQPDDDDDNANGNEQDAADQGQDAHTKKPSKRGRSTKKKDKRKRKPRRKKGSKEQKAHFWSVHDPDASFGHKGLGYHAHFTETCRNPQTELITDYDVVTAAQSDVGQARPAVERLRERGIAPETLYADGGYPTPSDLLDCRATGTELWAPVNRGRLSADSFSRMDFVLDDDARVIQCPAGHAPTRHGERASSDAVNSRRALHAFFDAHKCQSCPHLNRCPVRCPNNRRSHEYRLELSAELIARDQRWAEQGTREWQEPYRIRSGVEATMSELKRAHGVGRLRVRRIARVRLQVALKATACNIKRWAKAVLAQAGDLEGVLGALCALLTALFALWPTEHANRRVLCRIAVTAPC